MDFPFESKKQRINHEENGYNVVNTHSGQKRAYGDSFYEYTIKTDKPADEVEEYCTENVMKCGLTTEEYLADERAGVKDFGDHFRSNYTFRKSRDSEYRYIVTRPSTH